MDKSDVQDVYGVRVTRPLRTIIDLLRTKQVDESQLKLAVNEALRRGLIGTREIDHTSHNYLRPSLRELVGQPG